MKRVNKICFGLALSVVYLFVSPANFVYAAPNASTTVLDTVQKVREAVSEKEGSIAPENLDVELKKIISPVFDFREMSRRSLAAQWKKATPEQQKEFVDLFSDLLAKNYLKKIRENIAGSDLKILDERTSKKGKALVRTKVSAEKGSMAIDYRMRNKKDHWMVYDVIIENIGLVSNYRSEFAGIVKNEGIDGLLIRLREKK